MAVVIPKAKVDCVYVEWEVVLVLDSMLGLCCLRASVRVFQS